MQLLSSVAQNVSVI